MSENSIIEKFYVAHKFDDSFVKRIKLLYVFKDSSNQENALIVTNEDRVYAFGNNREGVLGFGNEKKIDKLTINEILCGQKIIDFRNGFCHVIARSESGKVYCWGSNTCGQLGNGHRYQKLKKVEQNKHLHQEQENITAISCGSLHTLALTRDGKVYAWGSNKFGQIGSGVRTKFKRQIIPYHIKGYNGEAIRAISCGFYHSMALTVTGRVFVWGSNQFGQLGFKPEENLEFEISSTPILIETDFIVDKISCGAIHCLMMSHDGQLCAFGCSKDGRLGTDDITGELITNMIKLKNDNKFIDIASHYDYDNCIALSDNGIFYIWGKFSKFEILSPKETQFNSFQEVFANYYGITHEVFRRHHRNINFETVANLMDNKFEQNFIQIDKPVSGGFGIVCKTLSKNTNEIFAIKKIALREIEKMKAIEESKIMTEVKSIYVVKCFDVWMEYNYILTADSGTRKDKGISSTNALLNPYKPLLLHIQMEFCHKNLREVIKVLDKELSLKSLNLRTSLSYCIACEIFKELLECVNYLHKRRPEAIIHRDLKPANILITNGMNGRFVKLADFGLAVLHSQEDESHSRETGTWDYMAPEVKQSRRYGTKADIYSLGVVTDELFRLTITPLNNSRELVIFKIISKMKDESKASDGSYDTNKRPDCDFILSRRKLWYLGLKKLINEEKKLINNEIGLTEKSLLAFFIITKLQLKTI